MKAIQLFMKENEIKTKGFAVKKTLIISILCLLFFFVLLLVYEYFRIAPNEVHFSNVTSSSVTVSWNTKSAIPATVIAKEGKGGFVNLFGLGKRKYYDSRDVTKAELDAVNQTAKNISNADELTVSMNEIETELIVSEKERYYTHHVVVKGLEPETEYSFLIGDSLLFMPANTETQMTLPVPDSVPTPEPAYGAVKDAQNRKNISINDLVPLNDGIVYLNFFDETTGVRSNVYSSAINDTGNWYMDLSAVRDQEGNSFFESYGNPFLEIVAEITIDAGPLGVWKKIEDADILTPSTVTVINDPARVDDYTIQGSVQKVENMFDEDIMGVTMAVLIPTLRRDNCNQSGGTWNESSQTCRCGANSHLIASTGVCECNSGYSRQADGSCDSINPPITPPSCTVTSCNAENPVCPAGYSTTYNGGIAKPVSKKGKDNCGDTCHKNITCYPIEEEGKKVQSCDFPVFCPEAGKCVSKYTDGSYSPTKYCDCPNEILKERLCDSADWTGQQEVKPTCDGKEIGSLGCVSGKCKVCSEFVINHQKRGRYADTGDLCSTMSDCSSKVPEGGPVCGTANGNQVPFETTTLSAEQRCQVGTSIPASVSFGSNFEKTWTCQNISGGIIFSTTCNATRSTTPATPSCGNANGTSFPSTTTTITPSTLCTVGSASPSVVNFGTNNLVSWTCNVGPINKKSCSATRKTQEQENIVTSCQSANPKDLCYLNGISGAIGKCSSLPSGTCFKEDKDCVYNGLSGKWNGSGFCVIPTESGCGDLQIGQVSGQLICTANKTLENISVNCNIRKYYDNNAIYKWQVGTGLCEFYGCRSGVMGVTYIESPTGSSNCIAKEPTAINDPEVITNDGLCIANSNKVYAIKNGKIYFCRNYALVEDVNNAEYQGSYCLDFSKNKGDDYCSPNGEYCFVDKLYYCKSHKWVDATDENKGNDIAVDNIVDIAPGKQCTGMESTDGNGACKCTFTGSVINVGLWCPESKVSDCPMNIGKICNLSGNTCLATGNNYGGYVDYCRGGINESQLHHVGNKEKCTYPRCICTSDGPDKGSTIINGEYCREIRAGLLDLNCESGNNLNKICNNNGNTCNHAGLCKGSLENTYYPGSKSIKFGEKCAYDIHTEFYQSYLSCKCPDSSVDTTVPTNTATPYFCRQVSKCTTESIGQICNTDGTTCSVTQGVPKCEGKKIDASLPLNKSNKPLLSQLIGTVLAQTDTINNYFIINQSAGVFESIQEGSYTFEHEGQIYYFTVEDDQPQQVIFIDKNHNEVFDDGIDILVTDLASTIKIKPVELRYTYNIKEGFNFVSFPFLPSDTDIRTAAGFIKKLNAIYDNSIFSISKYDESWKVVGQNDDVYSNNDFQLVPGQGYVIKAKNSIGINIMGKPIEYEKASDTAPISIFKGWNLVGIYGTGTKQYTAKSMLQDINAYDKIDFSANNVSKWDSEVQGYDGFQLDTTTEYGFDYPINQLGSYFVRVQDGTGNWQPQLAK